ncbi:MAG: hypothetical protein ABI165_18515 [Bryobacteraceae bacterium]
MTQENTFLERAGAWLLHSGIQEPGGGVARYYLSDVRRNAPVSTEITGYAASALTYLHSITGDSAYLKGGVRAARFLMREARDGESALAPFELSANGEPRLAYFFDCGIIARGLFAVARSTRDAEIYRAARAGCLSMADAFFSGGGPIPPVLRLPSQEPLPFEPRWSRSPGCYQLKSAMAWCAVDGLEELYDCAVEDALSSHADFLPGDSNREKVMDRLHAYLYFLEGLLPAAGRPECTRALADGIARVSGLLRDIAPAFARSDVYAQLLRVRLYADALGAAPLDGALAAEEAEEAAGFQAADEDPRIDGGFYFGRKGGAWLPFVNPVSTVFCMQALAMWRQYEAGHLRAPIEALI